MKHESQGSIWVAPVCASFSQADAASSKVSELQSELDNGNAGKDASDRLSVEISQLRAGVAAERVRFTHITEALEATKGSLEEVKIVKSGVWCYAV